MTKFYDNKILINIGFVCQKRLEEVLNTLIIEDRGRLIGLENYRGESQTGQIYWNVLLKTSAVWLVHLVKNYF